MDAAREGPERRDSLPETGRRAARSYPLQRRRARRVAQQALIVAIYVKLSTLARQEIQKELDRSRADISQGHETGGWLFAEKDTPWWRTEGITIEYASGPSDKAVRGPGAIDMDTDALFSAADVLLEKHGLEVVGAWHIHPGGDDQPSDTDIERVAALLSFRSEWGCRTQCGLEMILTPQKGRLGHSPVGVHALQDSRDRSAGRVDRARGARNHEGGGLVIAGFESLENVLGVLSGLEHEKPRSEAHAEAIAAQKKLFEAERDRMLALEAERIEREHQARLAAAQVGARIK